MQANPIYIRRPFGKSYGLWEWEGEHFPRTRFPAGSTTRSGAKIDLQTGEVAMIEGSSPAGDRPTFTCPA